MWGVIIHYLYLSPPVKNREAGGDIRRALQMHMPIVSNVGLMTTLDIFLLFAYKYVLS